MCEPSPRAVETAPKLLPMSYISRIESDEILLDHALTSPP